MKKLNPSKYKEDFDTLINKLAQSLEKLNSQENKFYDKKDKKNYTIISTKRGVNKDCVEHIEQTSAILVPEWVTTTNFFKDDAVEKMFAEYEEYYLNKNQNKPRNMWAVPLVLKFFYHEHDYKITMNNEGDVTNSVNKFISYDKALEKFALQQEFTKFMNKLAEDLLKEHEEDFYKRTNKNI